MTPLLQSHSQESRTPQSTDASTSSGMARGLVFIAALAVSVTALTVLVVSFLQVNAGMDSGTSSALTLSASTLVVRGQAVQVYAPIPIAYKSRLPVVMVLHGTGDTAGEIKRMTMFSELARLSQGFFAVFPEMPPSKHGAWGFMDASDLARFENILDELEMRHPVQRDAIFLVGHSEGGTVSMILGNNAPHLFRAVAAVESGVPGNLTLYNWNLHSYGSPVMLVWNMRDPVLSAYKVPGCSNCTLYQHTLRVLRRHAPTEKPDSVTPVKFTGHNIVDAEKITWPSSGKQAEMQMVRWSSRIPTHSWSNPEQIPGCFDSAHMIWDFFQSLGPRNALRD